MTTLVSKKLIILACIPSGMTDVMDGYRHRVVTMVESLRDIGFDVRILWFYRIQDHFTLQKSQLKQTHSEDFFRPVLPFFLNRSLGLLSRRIAKIWLNRLYKEFNFDYIQAETALHGAICSRFKGKSKIVVDFHGDVVAEMEMNNQSNWKLELTLQDEKEALKNATAIIAASEALIELLCSRHNLTITLAAAAPCGVDVERFIEARANRIKQRKLLKLEERIVFCYLGGLQKWQNIDETITLFKKIYRYEKRAYLLIITNSDTSECRKQLSAIGECGENYNFLALTGDDVPVYLPSADFGILLRSNSPVNRVASPTKFGEYLAAGFPVITTPFAGDASRIAEESGCGFLVDDQNEKNFEQLLAYVVFCMKGRDHIFNLCREAAHLSQSWQASKMTIKNIYNEIDMLI